MNKQEKYVIDSRYFSGYCITYMKDGIRSDFGEETLEELRIRENNPFLIAVSRSRIEKMLQIYQQGLAGPFKEITENEYYDLMDILPPLRLQTDSFFVGEPYSGSYIPSALHGTTAISKVCVPLKPKETNWTDRLADIWRSYAETPHF